jgi:hypothetical protein
VPGYEFVTATVMVLMALVVPFSSVDVARW